MNAIKNITIYDFKSFHPDSYVIFDSKIIETGDMSDFASASQKYRPNTVTDGSGKLLLPGFTICHTHIYSSFARGMILPFNPKNFVEVLEQLWWKMDAALDSEAVYYSGLVSALGYITNGVSTVIDHHASGRDILGTLNQLKKAVVDDYGLRGMFCFETSDRFAIDQCIQENMSFYKSSKSGEFGGHFGLHASMTLSDDTLRAVKSAAGEIPIHIHAAESILDQEDSQKRSGMNVLERLKKFDLLNKNSLIVHGAHLSPKEMDLIAEHDCRLVINPSSNMNNGVGLPDFKSMKNHGVKILLGNDGMSNAIANEWQFLLFGMHHRYLDPMAFDLGDLLEVIENGYEYTSKSLGVKLGRIESGYEADFQLLEYTPPTPMTENNVLGHLFYGNGFSYRPSDLWAKGKLKLENYQIKTESPDLEPERIYERSRSLAQNLWDELR